MSIASAVAVHRFGLGPQQGELTAADDPLAWLDSQIMPKAALVAAPNLQDTKAALTTFATLREHRKSLRSGNASAKAVAALEGVIKTQRSALRKEVETRMGRAITTPAPFADRWARFWSNHFTVAATRAETIGLAGPYEREAIRPHVFGRFPDLLEAAVLHPGMLMYLDNHRSVGPSTRIAGRRGLGLNENLAREVLELHTLGVNGGYGQSDVESLAKALTGWMPIAPRVLRTSVTGNGMFVSPAHEPGAKRLLGKRYGSDGQGQAKAMLADLATHRSTANHVAHKLARHFVADEPPKTAVAALSSIFRRTGGDLSALARGVIRLEGAFEAPLQKVKTPEELMIASARMLGQRAVFGQARRAIEGFAQRPFGAPSPAGWPDTADAWLSPDALKKRIDWAGNVAKRARLRPDMFVDAALGPLADPALVTAIARAESPAQGLTLALMSPQFQRR
ncbi:MAG: DUF1800 domain-containing protein [Pseudomonadota bacterium]